jgi:hypothetical protein
LDFINIEMIEDGRRVDRLPDVAQLMVAGAGEVINER